MTTRKPRAERPLRGPSKRRNDLTRLANFDQPVSGRQSAFDRLDNRGETSDQVSRCGVAYAQPDHGRPRAARTDPDGEILVLAQKHSVGFAAPGPQFVIPALGKPEVEHMLTLMTA